MRRSASMSQMKKKYVGKDYSLKENKVIGKTGLNLLSITL